MVQAVDGRDVLLRIEQRLARQYPDRLLWAFFPTDGGLEPIPAGESVLELERQRIVTPKGELHIAAPPEFLRRAQSMVLVVDGPVFVSLEPGYGSFSAYPNFVIHGYARDIERVRLSAFEPYLLMIALGNAPNPPVFQPTVLGQARFSSAVLVKSAPAGSDDPWTNVKFVPRWMHRTLDVNLFGVDYIVSAGIGQKAFVVRNLGADPVEVRVQGTMIVALARELEAQGGPGWVDDPQAGGVTTVAPGGASVLETSALWGAVRLQARVAASAPSGAQVPVTVEYGGVSFAVR